MYLFFDTETNGLPRNWKAPVSDLANWPRLVQLAWMLFDESGQEIERNDYIIQPNGFSIPSKTSKIHGISTQRAQQEGVALRPVLEEFNRQVDKAHYLVAHNMAFDEKIIGAEFLRQKMPNPLPSKSSICTMQATTDYVGLPGRYGYKWPNLSELHQKLFETDFEEAHNAAADIEATANCFWEARKRGVL